MTPETDPSNLPSPLCGEGEDHVESRDHAPAITAVTSGQPETGWLIEAWSSRRGEYLRLWWMLGSDGETDPDWETLGSWTPDSTKALRFAREIDAQAYIDATGWTEARPTEHRWG